MANETLIISILGIIVGALISYVLLEKFKLKNKIETRRQRKIINNPEKLKELLEKNGDFIDEGKKISFKITEDAKGKSILTQETEKIITKPPKIIKIKKPKKKVAIKKLNKKKKQLNPRKV